MYFLGVLCRSFVEGESKTLHVFDHLLVVLNFLVFQRRRHLHRNSIVGAHRHVALPVSLLKLVPWGQIKTGVLIRDIELEDLLVVEHEHQHS